MTDNPSKTISNATFNKIIQIEAAGNPKARSNASGASGLFQFIYSTWMTMVKRYRPDFWNGRNAAQVAALRFEPDAAIELGARFTEENAHGLGAGYTEGDLYLAHFLGLGGARHVLQADPNTRVEPLVGEAAVKANPTILPGRTCGQVRAWAQRSMDQRWLNAGKPDWIAKLWKGPLGKAQIPMPKARPDDIPDDEQASHYHEDEAQDAEQDATDAAPEPVEPADMTTVIPPPTPRNQTPAKGMKVSGDPDTWWTQYRLKAMHYYSGDLDGKYGGKLSAAIAGFINDRKLPMQAPNSEDQFREMLPDLGVEFSAAEAEDPPFVRPVTRERAEAKPDFVDKIAPEAKPVRRNFITGTLASVGAMFGALWQGIGDTVKGAFGYVTEVKEALPDDIVNNPSITGWLWDKVTSLSPGFLLTMFGILFAFFAWNAFHGTKAIHDKVATGER